jgi:hypothetical protein
VLLILLLAGRREAAASAGNSLVFPSGTTYVEVPHNAAFNASTLTVSFWIKTTDTSTGANAIGLVSKYVDASGNGWSVLLDNGYLRGWYFGVSGGVYNFSGGMYGNFIADGQWHHVAMVIDSTGGRFYTDGAVTGTLGWLNTVGSAATTTAPVRIGNYNSGYPTLNGQMDEISIWNVSRTQDQVRELRRNPLVGNESGLQGYWRCNEAHGSGSLVDDSSSNNRDGTVIGTGYARTASTLMFGSLVNSSITSISDNNSRFIIAADASNSAPAYNREGVQASANLSFTRPNGGPSESIGYQAAFRLLDAGGTPVPLATGGTEVAVAVNAGFLFSSGSSTTNLSSSAVLTPSPAITPKPVYRIQVILRRADISVPGAFVEEGSSIHTGFQYWQFTHTASTDAAEHVLGRVDSAVIPQRVLIGSSGAAPLNVNVNVSLARYDEFLAGSPSSQNVTFTLTPRIRNVSAGNAIVPLASGAVQVTRSLASFVEGSPRAPFLDTFQHTVQPVPASALSPTNQYLVEVDISWTETGGAGYLATASSDTGPIVSLSGRINFGSFQASYTGLSALPSPSGGNYVLQISSGGIPGFPNHFFSGTFTVSLNGSNDAQVVSGSAVVTTSTPDTGTVANVRYLRKPITLSTAGASTNLEVWFPAGFGVLLRTSNEPDFSGAIWPKGSTGSQSLGANLLPTSASITMTPQNVRDGNYTPVGTEHVTGMYGVHEQIPYWMLTNNITWNIQAGTFTLPTTFYGTHHSDEYDALPSEDRANHPSNEQMYGTYAFATTTTIKAGPGGVALLNANINPSPSPVNCHFPVGGSYNSIGGTVKIDDGVIDTAVSQIVVDSAITQVVSVNGPEDGALNCPSVVVPDQPYVLDPNSQPLKFTADGGLIITGNLNGQNLFWGTVDRPGGGAARYAHTLSGFSTGTFYQAGNYLAGSVAKPTSDDGPGVLLLSGFGSPTDEALVERPGGPGYGAGLESDGQANYPGLNLRYAEDLGIPTSWSLISGQNIVYSLTPRSKYYARQSGVSGIHERVTTGTPLNLTLYGFQAQLDYFKLAYLSNENTDSVTDGGLTVPFPSGFSQEFLELRFTSRGQPIGARLPVTGNNHELAYWGRANFDTLSLGFTAPKPAFTCDLPPPDKGALVLGVRMTELPYVATPSRPLVGTLAFRSNGNLITKADQDVGGVVEGTQIDSRLDLPGNLQVSPPSGGSFRLIPTTNGYFNTPPAGTPTSATDGFLTFAGRLSVPFFEELKVHIHTGADIGGQGIYFMGGWPSSDKAGNGEGWADGSGRSYFSHPEAFDPGHVGHPGNLAAYRNSPSTQYRPRARKVWLDLVDFDFPLNWDATTQRFSSFQASTLADLLVLQVQSELRALTPTKGEIIFGGDANVPSLNAQQLIVGATDGVAQDLFADFNQAIDEAITSGISTAATATKLTDAADALDDLLGNDFVKLVDAPLDSVLDPMLNSVIDPLYAAGTATVADLRVALTGVDGLSGIVSANHVPNQILNATGAGAVRQQLIVALDKSIDGVTSLRDLIKRYPPENQRQILRRLVRIIATQLIEDSGLASIAVDAAEILDSIEFIQKLESHPVFDELSSEADSLIAQLTQIRNSLANPGGAFSTELTGLASDANALDSDLSRAVREVLDQVVTYGSQLSEHSPAELKKQIKRAIKDRVYGSFVPQRLQFVFRSRVGGQRGLFRGLLDETIAQISASARQALLEAAAGADISAALGGISEFPDFPETASIEGLSLRGYGRIVGHSMTEARLDGRLKLGLPDKSGITFEGFVQIRDVQVEGVAPGNGCGGPGADPRAKSEVTMGAKLGTESGGGGFADGMQFGLEAQVAFDQAGNNLGFLGTAFLVPGEGLSVGKTSFREATLELAWVPGLSSASANRYLKAVVDGQIEGVGAKVKLFLGQTCNIQQLGVLDPYMERAMKSFNQLGYGPGGITQVAGVFLGADGQFPLEALIGLPPGNPFLSAIAKGGNSWMFVKAGGGDPGSNNIAIGYRQSVGVDATILVVIEASAELGAAGIGVFDLNSLGNLNPLDLDFAIAIAGRAEFCGSVFGIGGCVGLEVLGTMRGTDVTITGASF